MKRLIRIGVLVAIGLGIGSFAVSAQTCPSCITHNCHTPAVSAPSQLWGELEPGDNGTLPVTRDSSHLSDYGNPESIPRWMSVDPIQDASGAWLFAVTNMRIQTFRLSPNPGLPVQVSDKPLSQTGMDVIVDAHTATVFMSVRAAPLTSNQIALGGVSGAGVAVFDTTNKPAPVLRYQDRAKEVQEVYTARLANGRDYLFAAGALTGVGVRAYDLTRIAGLTSACVEAIPTANLCPSVHVGSVGPTVLGRATSIHGTGNYVAIGAPAFEANGGIYIYNVSSPATPLQTMSGLQGTPVYDVAMWQQGANYYLAVRTFNQARIYDVSCITGGSCSIGSPIWSQSMPSSTLARVSFSRSGSVPMLYWSTSNSCTNGTTGETLHNVTNPAAPDVVGEPAYFQYYHWSSATGFNYLAPIEARFLNDWLYRAAFSVLDSHKWTSGGPPAPPTIGSVSASPNPASVCQPVTFTAGSVTGGSGANFSWEVRNSSSNAFVAGNEGVNLTSFLWDTTAAGPGTYKGYVVAENAGGPSAEVASATVTVNPLTALPGNETFAPIKVSDSSGAVKFDVNASGATQWSWDFGDSGGVFAPFSNDPVNGKSPTHVYASTGSKTVRVQVKNCAEGPVTSQSLVIDVPVVNPLVASFAFASCAFQLAGPTCQANSGLNFVDSSTGAQSWDYDWDCQQGGSGCGSFEEANKSSPVTNHTYSSGGTYTPQLRVKRGAEEHVFTHSAIFIQGASPPTPTPTPTPSSCGDNVCTVPGESPFTCPADCGGSSTPSLQISGPTQGNTGAAYVYTASANNCTPNQNGWNWTHTGTAPTTTTNSIGILWSTGGSKSITVTNSGCAGAFDSHQVNIASGANIVAAFTTQVSGLTVSFNAASSQGSPTSFLWNFGDGQAGNGMSVQHTYAAPGSYTVLLSVARQDPACAFNLCASEKSSVVQVGGGTPTPTPTPPPPIGLCQPDADTFCAVNGDFKIEVDWEKKNGETGVGRVVSGATSDNTGIFYFFEQENWELLLKVLDACSINDHYWVFGGAASNVKYQIRVTDLVTDDVWTYDNPQGKSSEAITDIQAFATCSVDRNLMRANAAAAQLDARLNLGGGDPTATPTPTPSPTPSPTVIANVGPCDPTSTTLCALSERFQVKVSWETKNGNTGNGAVIPATTDNTGVFWFFEQDNWELLIKVLNGCGVNGRFWVFGAGATDVNYVVTVDDLQTGATWEYENAQGEASPAITDTSAFDTCTP